MEAFTQHTGTAVPLMNDNIDTDQIIPKSFLKRIEKTGFGEFLFDEWRYLPDRTPNPEFTLNEPQYKGATILISGDNFGSGSSREHAAWALDDYGFRAVIAGSFSDIFYMNATKNGLLPIVLKREELDALAGLQADEMITIDLPAQQVVTSIGTYSFEIDSTWKHKLVNGLDEIAISLTHDSEIAAYEAKIPAYWQ
ncbi:3-isopropylmalate dehydratase small subunit [Enterococcus ureilyticus]|uniref:3-isopropylmalate dehydratase small subunit n=1 Tax=Enterococcus ureilyticus TaxID=1131292 RepID=A0A1E5HDJ4_9ENTE|nr:3-isopropylmalate dehydratase small subunit [Enterococcus ureilyticus]MBM7689909.1 3-isopropylmalate/(R)-2-methylmalate dehydratase small subunit [Enterococcus ureilyticus]MBO0446312.1 3-isopropylmalate dehydratase small subunit [Enterococcus ureilyticus]OEG23013.1 3-isopropylmalate dehydratase small subunit [Enterococcus ureilyticus]